MSKPHIRVVVARIERGGRYLITQRMPHAVLPLLWEFPGGRVEEGEQDEDALVRELRENLDNMNIIITTLLALSAAQAADDTGACDDFGTIAQPASVIATVRAGDDPIPLNTTQVDDACGDVAECHWRVEGTSTQGINGLIDADCGSPAGSDTEAEGGSICYRPPDSLPDCLAIDVQILLDCGDSGDPFELVDNAYGPDVYLRAGQLIDSSEECTTTATVSGGGCISAQGSGVATAAWLLFPMIGLGGLARRRED
jgi:ADP-ribose pyrophosphatase YjhB (NUDIX family)